MRNARREIAGVPRLTFSPDRFDVRLKHIRRHSRIIVPTEVMPVASGESDTAIEEENVSKKKRRFLLLPTDPIRTRFDFLMMSGGDASRLPGCAATDRCSPTTGSWFSTLL